MVVGSPLSHSCVLRSSYVRCGPICGNSSDAVTAAVTVGSGVGVDIGDVVFIGVGVAVGGASVGVAGPVLPHPAAATVSTVANATREMMIKVLRMALGLTAESRCRLVGDWLLYMLAAGSGYP